MVAGFPATIHAGEAAGVDSISEAIHLGGAVRIGHGLRITDDIAFGDRDDDDPFGPAGARLGHLAHWLRALPWTDVPVGHTQTGRGHGRIEKRTVKVVTVAAGLGFPHAAQGIQVVRRSRPITAGTGKRAKWRTETVYAICTLNAAQAQPDELARWLRGHWGIENRLHWVR